MLKLDWNKLNPKQRAQISSIRPLNLLLGGIEISKKRFAKLVEDETNNGSTFIVGVLNDNTIPGLEGGDVFTPMKISVIEEYLNELIKNEKVNGSKVAILKHDFNDSKYVLKELNPDKILRVNGSGANVIHYQQIFWEAYNLDKKIEQISPYIDEEEAKLISNSKFQISKASFQRSLDEKVSVVKSDLDISNMLQEILNLSWDWTGRTAALIVREHKVISWSENRVLGYPGLMLHEGSVREQKKIPIGQNMEYYETIHAEQGAILNAIGKLKEGELADCVLYTTKFVCPMCSKIVAASGIKKMIYVDEYTSQIGYKQLEMCGVEMKQIKA